MYYNNKDNINKKIPIPHTIPPATSLSLLVNKKILKNATLKPTIIQIPEGVAYHSFPPLILNNLFALERIL